MSHQFMEPLTLRKRLFLADLRDAGWPKRNGSKDLLEMNQDIDLSFLGGSCIQRFFSVSSLSRRGSVAMSYST